MRAELFCYNFSRFFPSILFSLNTFCFAFLFFALFSNKKLKKTKTWRSQLHYEYFLFFVKAFCLDNTKINVAISWFRCERF